MRYNKRLQFVSGAGGPVSINSTVIASVGTCAQWLDDDHVVANTPAFDGVWRTCVYSLLSGQWAKLDDKGCNFLAAGGGRWIAQLTNPPVVFGYINEPTASLTLVGTDQRGAAAEDGTIATLPTNSGGFGLQLRTAAGTVTNIPGAVVARDVYVIDANRVIWRDDAGVLHAHGVYCGAVAGPVSRPQYVYWNDIPYMVYFTPSYGVVAHPVDRLDIGRIVFVGSAFHHDSRVYNGRLWVGASVGVGELPGEERGVDVYTRPIVALSPITHDPVVSISRRHWLMFFEGYPGAQGGWDTNDDPSSAAIPSNSVLVTPDGLVIDSKGRWFGTFIHGTEDKGVDWVESQAWAIAPTGKTPIAYWDGRRWPRWPTNLPAMSWMCIQAYCRNGEPLDAFEADIRSIIADPTRPQFALAMVAQASNANTGLTQDIAALVPVYSRIARDTPSMIATIGFNGNGRTGGLQHNQHAIPSWEQYFNGIVGAPNMADTDEFGKVNGVVIDPEKWFRRLVQGQNPANYRPVLAMIEPELFRHGFGQQTNGVGGPDPDVLRGRLFAPWLSCPNAAPREGVELDERYHVNFTPACCGLEEHPCAFVNVVNNPPTQWIWDWHGPAYQPYVPATEPEPAITIEVHGYDPVCSRSNPRGCGVDVEVTSAGNVNVAGTIAVWLEGSGERIRPFRFATLEDLHFFRGLRWKFGVPGQWPLIVEVRSDDGRVVRSDGSHMITVVA